MNNVTYTFDGDAVHGRLPDGTVFLFDKEDFCLVDSMKWYACVCPYNGSLYITNGKGKNLHRLLLKCPHGMEIDHINLDTLDNRRNNLRICTHQQNQMNQPLQKNNTSGVTGVSYYPPRKKYRARIKVNQHEIHLGYYSTFTEAVQARNVGMQYMFGEYGRLNDVSPAPKWIQEKVYDQCMRFKEYVVSGALLYAERVS